MSDDAALTPRRAVEAIFHGTQQLAQFVDLLRESLAINLEFQRLITEANRAHGQPVDLGPFQTLVQRTDKIAGSALIQSFDDTSYLFGLATVRLWTTLESGVNDLVIVLLERDESWKTLEVVKRSKVRLGDFMVLSGKDQMKFLLDELLTETKARYQAGVKRYEVILTAVGCGGDVNDDVRKTILEIAETRHLLVHRGGRADTKFRDRCPWVPIWGGGIVRVGPGDFGRFTLAVMSYMGELMVRLQRNGWFDGTYEDWIPLRDNGLRLLREVIENPRTAVPGSPQALWDDLLRWKDGAAPPNPFRVAAKEP